MKAVVQRVLHASVEVEGALVSQIGHGLLVLICIEVDDTEKQAQWMAAKLAGLRIFSDAEGKMNLSLHQTLGELLLVSQFTLAGKLDKGFRPSFIKAARPEQARPLLSEIKDKLEADLGRSIQEGVFGADMKVSLVNDGPVTIMMEAP